MKTSIQTTHLIGAIVSSRSLFLAVVVRQRLNRIRSGLVIRLSIWFTVSFLTFHPRTKLLSLLSGSSATVSGRSMGVRECQCSDPLANFRHIRSFDLSLSHTPVFPLCLTRRPPPSTLLRCGVWRAFPHEGGASSRTNHPRQISPDGSVDMIRERWTTMIFNGDWSNRVLPSAIWI